MSSTARTISSMQNRSWTRSWPPFAIRSANGAVGEQPDDRRGQGLGLVVRDEDTRHAVLDHLRDPADIGRDDRPRQRHRLEDREALGLAVRRQHGDVERGGDRRDVVAPAGEHDPVGDAVRGGPMLERVAHRALADDEEIRVRHRAEDVRPGVDQRLVALLGLEPGDDPDHPRSRLHAVLVAQVRGRLLVVVAPQVDAVVDQLDRRETRPLVGDLRDDRVRHRDQLVHLGREAAQRLAILRGPDARGVDRRHEVRPRFAGVGHREDRLRRDRRRRGTCGCGRRRAGPGRRYAREPRPAAASSGSSMSVTWNPARSSLRTALPADSATMLASNRGGVETAHQPEDVLLGAAVRARRKDLDDANPPATGRALAVDRREAGVPGDRRRHQAHLRAASRRTRIRWIGSSTAPHSYL
jgi:hypothetical protein